MLSQAYETPNRQREGDEAVQVVQVGVLLCNVRKLACILHWAQYDRQRTAIFINGVSRERPWSTSLMIITHLRANASGYIPQLQRTVESNKYFKQQDRK